MTESKWYFARGNQPRGPVSLARLREMAGAGGLLPTDRVLQAGTQRWLLAGDVAGLFPGPAPPPAGGRPSQAPAPPAAGRPPARRRTHELAIALVLVLAVSGFYVFLAWDGIPRPSSSTGYALGIGGLLLMLSTETLYSWRKRSRRFHRGRMSTWLEVHIVTGIVGPYLVLLHSAGRFHGLAGVLAMLTAVLVVSGFVGRYIYTAVPRTLDGVEVAVRDLEAQVAATDRDLQALGIDLTGTEVLKIAGEAPPRGWRLVLERAWLTWRYRRRLRRALRRAKVRRGPAAKLERLILERHRLQMQAASLAVTRRLLALWHLLHYPIGAAVFTLAFIHVGAAIYFAALLK